MFFPFIGDFIDKYLIKFYNSILFFFLLTPTSFLSFSSLTPYTTNHENFSTTRILPCKLSIFSSGWKCSFVTLMMLLIVTHNVYISSFHVVLLIRPLHLQLHSSESHTYYHRKHLKNKQCLLIIVFSHPKLASKARTKPGLSCRSRNFTWILCLPL